MNDLSVTDVGVEKFNKDHQRLLFYILEFNRLAARFRLRTPFSDEWDQMDAIFDRLEKFTIGHFSEEERAMAQINYPALADHQKQHQKLIKTLVDLKQKVSNREFQSIGTVKQFLLEWLTNHINQTDALYKPFLESNFK